MGDDLRKAAADFEDHVKTTVDPSDSRHMAKVRRKLALDVIAPLKGLSRTIDDDRVFTMQRGEIQQDFKIPGNINAILKAAQETMKLLGDIDI